MCFHGLLCDAKMLSILIENIFFEESQENMSITSVFITLLWVQVIKICFWGSGDVIMISQAPRPKARVGKVVFYSLTQGTLISSQTFLRKRRRKIWNSDLPIWVQVHRQFFIGVLTNKMQLIYRRTPTLTFKCCWQSFCHSSVKITDPIFLLHQLYFNLVIHMQQKSLTLINRSQQRCFVKRPVLKIFSIFTGRPTTLLKRDSNAGVFLLIFQNFVFKNLFYRTSIKGCFYFNVTGFITAVLFSDLQYTYLL